MKPQYISIVGGTPKVVLLDTNIASPNISVRTDATTTEYTLEDPGDVAPTWVAAPAAGSNGLINFKEPVRAIRFTKATDGLATILRQGLQ